MSSIVATAGAISRGAPRSRIRTGWRLPVFRTDAERLPVVFGCLPVVFPPLLASAVRTAGSSADRDQRQRSSLLFLPVLSPFQVRLQLAVFPLLDGSPPHGLWPSFGPRAIVAARPSVPSVLLPFLRFRPRGRARAPAHIEHSVERLDHVKPKIATWHDAERAAPSQECSAAARTARR